VGQPVDVFITRVVNWCKILVQPDDVRGMPGATGMAAMAMPSAMAMAIPLLGALWPLTALAVAVF